MCSRSSDLTSFLCPSGLNFLFVGVFPLPDWKSGMSVPTDIAIAYLIQGSFYGHSIYATVYMDAWRKDSAVMVVHHIITLALICFSYAFRWVRPPSSSLGPSCLITLII